MCLEIVTFLDEMTTISNVLNCPKINSKLEFFHNKISWNSDFWTQISFSMNLSLLIETRRLWTAQSIIDINFIEIWTRDASKCTLFLRIIGYWNLDKIQRYPYCISKRWHDQICKNIISMMQMIFSSFIMKCTKISAKSSFEYYGYLWILDF